eukprot:762446-Hanusia_phi.AAC.1
MQLQTRRARVERRRLSRLLWRVAERDGVGEKQRAVLWQTGHKGSGQITGDICRPSMDSMGGGWGGNADVILTLPPRHRYVSRNAKTRFHITRGGGEAVFCPLPQHKNRNLVPGLEYLVLMYRPS